MQTLNHSNNNNITYRFIEIRLSNDAAFNVIRETLSRIGVASRRSKELFQSCHILHKRGRYFIVHFKEMFMLDGKSSVISDQDLRNRNFVAKLVVDWGLAEFSDKNLSLDTANVSLKVLTFAEKETWKLSPKYTIGKQAA